MAFQGESSWLSDYNACEILCREIMEQLALRNKQQRNSSGYSQINIQVRHMVKKFSSDIIQLRQRLIQASANYQITTQEMERRERMLNNLFIKEKELESAVSNQDTGARSERTSLLGGGLDNTAVTSWGQEESEATKDLTFDEIRQKQQQAIKEQDQGLEGLSRIISRQKQMAIGIGDELDVHNEILDDINEHVDSTHSRLIRETRNVATVTRKSATCVYWIIVVLLLIAIIVVAVVPTS